MLTWVIVSIVALVLVVVVLVTRYNRSVERGRAQAAWLAREWGVSEFTAINLVLDPDASDAQAAVKQMEARVFAPISEAVRLGEQRAIEDKTAQNA